MMKLCELPRFYRDSICIAGIALVLTSHASAGVTFSARMLEDEPAPGTEPGTVFNWFLAPSIKADGRVIAFANLAGPGIDGSNAFCIVSETESGLELTARSGDVAPGLGGAVHFGDLLYPIRSNSAGQVFFRCYLVGAGVTDANNSALVKGTTGSLTIVAREGDPVPGAGPDVLFGDCTDTNPKINGVGQCAFLCHVTGTGVNSGNDLALFSEGSGILEMVVREGDPAPGADVGDTFSSLGIAAASALRLTNDGHVTFYSSLAGVNVNSDNEHCIYTNRNGSLEIVARAGDPAPGTGDGALFDAVLVPSIEVAGGMILNTSLTGAGVLHPYDRAIFSERSGPLTLLHRGGDPAPGLAPGVNYWAFDGAQVNELGQIAFNGVITGTGVNSSNSDCIFSEGPGSMTLIAREGDPAAGTASGILYTNFQGLPVIAPDGKTLYWGDVAGPGVEFNVNSRCIWIADSEGAPVLVGRRMDPIDIDDDPLVEDIRNIFFISFDTEGAEEARASCFDSEGRFATTISFFGGTSGVFVVTLETSDDCVCVGDVNADTMIDGLDLQEFTLCLIADPGISCSCADIDSDGAFDVADLSMFVDLLINEANCS